MRCVVYAVSMPSQIFKFSVWRSFLFDLIVTNNSISNSDESRNARAKKVANILIIFEDLMLIMVGEYLGNIFQISLLLCSSRDAFIWNYGSSVDNLTTSIAQISLFYNMPVADIGETQTLKLSSIALFFSINQRKKVASAKIGKK